MAGLLSSFKPTPLSMGLLNAGANMMIAGGPSRMPTNLGTSLGAGLQGLLQGYSIENESQQERAYRDAVMQRQAENDAIELQIKQAQLANVGKPRGSSLGYIPANSTPYTDPVTGLKAMKDPEGNLYPISQGLSQYQEIMTDPRKVAQIAQARSAATEGEKVQNVPMGPEGAPTFLKNKDLTSIMPSLIQTESSGNPNAVSKAGARGLTQLMPSTAAMYTDNPLENLPPDQQIEIGAKYLADLTRQYDGDYKKALEAYNMGPGNIAKGKGNKAYADKILGIQPQTEAQKEDIKTQAKTKELEAKARIEKDQFLIKKKREANDVIMALQQAAPLVDKSTGSGFGNIVDQTAGFFGKSTKGAEAADQLKVLGETITMKMPKPAGPQSDADMKRAENASARIQDPTIPIERKKEAMQTLADYLAVNAGMDPVKLNFGGGEIGSSGTMSDEELDARLEQLMKGR